ncbi:MAG: hypothetical protein FVQ82_10080 [Planctomycetes bacterium]|nr:hypothetical protein [Planctomycetota bacterium]
MNKISDTQYTPSQGGPMTPAESMKMDMERANNINSAFQSMRDMTADEFASSNSIIPIGGGYSIDLVNGTIVFDFSRLNEERDARQSTNYFIETLRNSGKKMFSTFQELMSNTEKTRDKKLEMDLSTNKQKTETLLKKIMKEASMFSNAYKSMDSSKVMSLLC